MADHSEAWIVVGIDGSGSSAAAVRWAVKEAGLRAATLHLVFAAEELRYLRAPYAGSPDASDPDGTEPGKNALRAAAREASKTIPPDHVSAELAEGSPAQVLIDRSVGAELLVLGSACQPRQSASEGPSLVGSVARVCLRRAACPVVVVAGSRSDQGLHMPDKTHVPEEAVGFPSEPAQERSRQFGLTTAMALIVGSIIGVGIFNLPTSLAAYGPITLVSMGLTTVGALALALLFAALSRRLPADGGPYAYARAAFGNRLGFAIAWSYWITAWAGNAAIAVGWVLYVEHFINTDHTKWISVLLVLAGLWIPASVNLSGVTNMGSVQVITTIVKFVVLAFMATVGLFYIRSANFTPWNVSAESAISAIGGGMAIALFSYLGVETAAVAAAKVRSPDRNIPRATILGTIATAIVYMLSLTAVFGIVPTGTLVKATAPFSDAANSMFGGTWAGNVLAVAVIISGFGALNGWTMICAEMPLAAAKDGLFPERFKRISKRQVPAFGIVASTMLASIAMIINYLGSGGATVFTTLVLMTGITAAIPYGFSALAQLKWRWMDHKAAHAPHVARDLIVATLSLIFSILFIIYSRNAGHSFWIYWAPFFLAAGALLLGVPVYLRQRHHMSRPEPVRPSGMPRS